MLGAFCEKLHELARVRHVIAWDVAAVIRKRAATITVAILAQGTSWAVADTQAFLPGGSIPTRVGSQSAIACWRSAVPVVLSCVLLLLLLLLSVVAGATSTPCALEDMGCTYVAPLDKYSPCNGFDVVA